MHLLEAFGEIDDRFLTEAEAYPRKSARRLALRCLSAAACLAVAVTGGVLYTRLNGIDTAGNQSASTAATTAESETAVASDSAMEATPFAAPSASGNAASSLPAQENRLTDSALTAKEDAACVLDGLRYAAVTNGQILTEAGLPASPAPEDRGSLLDKQEAGEIYAYAPLAEVPAVRLLQDGETLCFLLCCGVEDSRTFGELFAFEGPEAAVLLGETALPEESGALLAALTPAEEAPPSGEAAASLSLALPGGLTARLGWYPADSLLVLGDDTAYRAEGELARLLASAAP